MSAEKELNFFIKERNWSKGVQWYEKHFNGKTPVRGEASPNYTFYPIWDGVPERMHSVIPKAKLIYILRDPVRRMVAEYVHLLADGKEHRSISDALQDFESKKFNCRSLYHMQLQRYLQYYPLSQILVLAQEDLLQRRRETLQAIFRFAGVDDSFYCEQFDKKKHQSVEKRQKNQIGLLLKRLSETPVARLVPTDVRQDIGKFLYRPFSKKITPFDLDSDAKRRITDFLRDDTDQLRKLVGKRFEEWEI